MFRKIPIFKIYIVGVVTSFQFYHLLLFNNLFLTYFYLLIYLIYYYFKKISYECSIITYFEEIKSLVRVRSIRHWRI